MTSASDFQQKQQPFSVEWGVCLLLSPMWKDEAEGSVVLSVMSVPGTLFVVAGSVDGVVPEVVYIFTRTSIMLLMAYLAAVL